jgi:hypothetical protein
MQFFYKRSLAIPFIMVLPSCGPLRSVQNGVLNSEASCASQTPAYADTVVQATGSSGRGFGDPRKATNGVRGSGLHSGSIDVFSLDRAQDGVLIIRWGGKTVCNRQGPDVNIFENGFVSTDGESRSFEPIVVSFSIDGLEYEDFPHSYTGTESPSDLADPNNWHGFAGLTPVFYNESNNNYAVQGVNPMDPVKAGGDVFELDSLSDSAAGMAIKLNGFRFLKLTAAPQVGFSDVPGSEGGYADVDGAYAAGFDADRP